MGVAANQARLMSLTARQGDLELRAQQISAEKMRLAMTQQSTSNAYSKALNEYGKNPDATGAASKLDLAEKEYDKSVNDLAAQEKLLDMELTQINTEHNAIKTEYDSIKSLIKDNVDKSFNIFS